MKKAIRIRQAVQLAALCFFLITVLQANYPFNPWIPPELFLWLDPLTALTTMAAERTWIPWFLLSVIVLVSPIIVGRGFCGWFCPLGTLIDISDRIIAPRKSRSGRRFRHWKTILLVLFIFSSIFSFQIVWLMDPLVLLWRTFGSVIFPLITFLFNGSFDLMLDAGLRSDFLFDFYDTVALKVLPLESTWVNGASIVAAMFVLVLGLSFFSKRFWCRNLCPLGALLGLLSKFSPFQRIVNSDTCNDCGLCNRGCKMGAIEDDFVTTEKSECIFCLNCSKVCKPGATSYKYYSPTSMLSPVDLTRRSFFSSSAAGIVVAGSTNLLHDTESRPDHFIRPPGARKEEAFLDRCIRCNECVRICATTGRCLQPVNFEAGFAAFWTPYADFSVGYCEFNCNLCGEICPTSAIETLPLKWKQVRVMGLAIIDEKSCIPFEKSENCIVCEEHCPTPNKAIVFEKRPGEAKDTGLQNGDEDNVLLLPKVNKRYCIGCGICETKCPVEGVSAIRIVREGEVRKDYRRFNYV